MKRVYDNIEQQYKNQFDNYEHDFDQSAMWQGLEASLPAQSQPKIALFALASAFFVSIFAGALWLNHEDSQISFAENVGVESIFEKDFIPSSEIIAADAQEELQGNLNTPTTSNSSIVAKEQTLQRENTLKRENTPIISTGEKLQNNLPQHTSKSTNSSSVQRLQNQLAANTAKTTSMMDLDENPMASAAMTGQQKMEELKHQISLLPSIASASISTSNLLQKELQKRDGDLNCPMVGGKRRAPIKGHGFIDVYGEGNFNMTTVEAQNTDTDAYQNSWNDTDTPLGSYELGVMLGYEFDNGLYAGLGLEYQKTVEKLEYQQTVIQRVTVWSEEAYFYIDENGDQVFVADSVTTQSIYERSVRSGKEHTILNLPLMLGYKLKGNNWNIGVFGGANINLSHKFEGKIINESNAFVTLDEDNYETVYKRKLGASFFGGLHLGRNIGNSMELYLNPTVRIYPNSWMQDDFSLSAKYNLAGLRLGLRYGL